MLALADKNGEVQASIPGLARIAGVPVLDCEEAIGKFLAPDPYSRTPDDEGRRIEKIDGGWALINHAKYRDMASREESKDAHAKRQKRYRDREKRNVTERDASVTPSDAPVTDTMHIADADTDADTENTNTPEGAALDAAASSEALAGDKTPLVLTFPCNGQSKTWGLHQSFLTQLSELYPSVDPLAQCRLALAKIQSGAVSRKTARGMSKFLFSWMDRATNSKPSNGAGFTFRQEQSTHQPARLGKNLLP